MGGLWNTAGHETEGMSVQASARFLEGMVSMFSMLAALEKSDISGAEKSRIRCVRSMMASANEFDDIARSSSDYPLFTQVIEELRFAIMDAVSRIREFGYSGMIRNSDLPRIASREIRGLANVIEKVQFLGRHADWYTFRDVIESSNRVTSLGVLVARISALHGKDPKLEH